MTASSDTEINKSPAKSARNKLTRQQQLQKQLCRKAGATIAQMRNAFG